MPCLLLSRETQHHFQLFVHPKSQKNNLRLQSSLMTHFQSCLLVTYSIAALFSSACNDASRRFRSNSVEFLTPLKLNDRIEKIRNEDGLPIQIVVWNVIHPCNRKLDALTHSFLNYIISFDHHPPEQFRVFHYDHRTAT